MLRTNLTPADSFLGENQLSYRHLAIEAARGNTLPLVDIGGDLFVTEDACRRFLGRIHTRSFNAATGLLEEGM